MKKIIYLFLFVFVFLVSCEQNDDNGNQEMKTTFQAIVLENNSTLLVEPLEGEQELRSADKITISTNNALLMDSEQQKIEATYFEPGMMLEIEYNGMIAESYPAQILTCYRISIMEE